MRRPNYVLFNGSDPNRLQGGCSIPVPPESVGVDANARGMIEWRSDSGQFDTPCGLCRVHRLDHDAEVMGHGWQASASETITDEEAQARINTLMREVRGDYEAPLPPPDERRRIREAAGLTQGDVADKLHVSRHTVSKFERRAGWINGQRLPGREPSVGVRLAYSKLLRCLDAPSG